MKRALAIMVAALLVYGNAYAQFPKRNWIRTFSLTYGTTDSVAMSFAGRHGMDVAVNLSDIQYGSQTWARTALRNANPSAKNFQYAHFTAMATSQLSTAKAWGQANGYDTTKMFIRTGSAPVTVNSWQNADCDHNGIPDCDPGTWPQAANREILFCQWCTMRYWPDLMYTGTQQYVISWLLGQLNNDVQGLMQDEAFFMKFTDGAPRSPAFPMYSNLWPTGAPWQVANAPYNTKTSFAQIYDTIVKNKQGVFYPALVTAMKNAGAWDATTGQVFMFPNPAAWGVVGTDVVDDMKTGIGMLGGEGWYLAPINAGSQGWIEPSWMVMDSVSTWKKGAVLMLYYINLIDTQSIGVQRTQRSNLCQYYMAHDPDYTYFSLLKNYGVVPVASWRKEDTLIKWTRMVEVNIGRPTGARAIVATGTDGAGQAYSLYRRNFTNGVVLWRKLNGSNYSTASAATYSLGGTYRPVNFDGTVGAPTATASVLNADGMIYQFSQADSTVSLIGGSAPEGDPIPVTVTIGTTFASPCTVTVNTVLGSGTGFASAADITTLTNQEWIVPAGQSSATFYVQTTEDAAVEPIETARVVGASVSIGHFGTSDVVISVVDDDEAPPQGGPRGKLFPILKGGQ